MPCSDSGWNEAIQRERDLDDKKFGNTKISEMIKTLSKDVDSIIVRNNMLAKMLCSIMRLADHQSRLYLINNIENLRE